MCKFKEFVLNEENMKIIPLLALTYEQYHKKFIPKVKKNNENKDKAIDFLKLMIETIPENKNEYQKIIDDINQKEK